MKVTYKQNGYDKEVWCNRAKTRLTISKTTYGMWRIYIDDCQLLETAYLDDAKERTEGLLKYGVGRNYKEER